MGSAWDMILHMRIKTNKKTLAGSFAYFVVCIARFQTDETSPAIWDPMNPEDYCYDILSKTLMKKAATSNEVDSEDTST